MRFIRRIITQHRKKVQERNACCDEMIACIDEVLNEAKSMFFVAKKFIDPQVESEWKKRNNGLLEETETHKIIRLKKASRFKILSDKQTELHNMARTMLQQILQHNEQVARLNELSES